MDPGEEDVDRYELAMRKKSARTNMAVGIALLVVAGGLFVATLGAIVFAGRLPWALPIFGVVLGGIGGRSFLEGLKSRAAARELEAQLGRR